MADKVVIRFDRDEGSEHVGSMSMWQRIGARAVRVLTVALLLAPLRVNAQDAATIADVRCVIIGMQLSGMTNSPQQSQGVVLTWYYIGRLDGRAPKLDIERLLIEETNRMASSDYASEARRCGAGLAERGQQVTQIGKDLLERGKKISEQPQSKR